MQNEDVLDAPVADDPHANDGYTVSSAIGGQAVPPAVFPEELARQQSPTQGGDTGESATAAPASDGSDERAGSGTDEDGDGKISVDEASREQLEAAVPADLTVPGTGSNGYVTVDDLKAALKAEGITEVAAAPTA